jgi:probable rRNA maturation factor
VVADDETVRELNLRYRGLDEVTDVLAFSPTHQGHYEGEEEPPPQETVPFPDLGLDEEPLGDVVISFPQAERQAAEAGHPVQRELATLVIHGVLHLLGYDHADPQEEQVMLARQQEALEQVPLEARAARRDGDS